MKTLIKTALISFFFLTYNEVKIKHWKFFLIAFFVNAIGQQIQIKENLKVPKEKLYADKH